MPAHLHKKHRHRPGSDPSVVAIPAGATATSSVAAGKWRLVFTTPILVKALPVDCTVNGAPPTAFVQDSPTQITLTFAVNVAAGQSWVIPTNSSNLRTPAGGHVAAATGTF